MERQTFTNVKDLKNVKNNRVIFEDGNGDSFSMVGSRISFVGEGNVLFVEKGVKLVNSSIVFNASNSIIYLSSSKYEYYISIITYNNSVFFIGKDCFTNKTPEYFKCILSEQKNVIIGKNCFFSLDVWIRLADPHLIFDATTNKRINYSKSVYIGDGVWIGQHVFLLKGAVIGSGSIIGALSSVSKRIPSNCVAAGSPAKVLKENIFWTGHCAHEFVDEDTEKLSSFDSDFRKFSPPENNTFIEDVETYFSNTKDVDKKLDFIKENLVKVNDKNRFAIKKQNKA